VIRVAAMTRAPGAGVELADLPLRENLRGRTPYGAPQLTFRCS